MNSQRSSCAACSFERRFHEMPSSSISSGAAPPPPSASSPSASSPSASSPSASVPSSLPPLCPECAPSARRGPPPLAARAPWACPRCWAA
eukprot:7385926-Prymnesium_polylepis.1